MFPDWSRSVQVGPGIYQRAEDFCNSTARGDHGVVTSGAVLMDEELLGVECGWRVANAVIELAVTGWDALLDAQVAEYERCTPT